MIDTPLAWSRVILGESCRLTNGRVFNPSEFSRSGLPIVRITNLHNKSASYKYFDGPIDHRYLIDNGDVLVPWVFSDRGFLKAHVWGGGPAILNQHIYRVAVPAGIDRRFFLYALNARLKEVAIYSSGAVGRQHIQRAALEGVAFWVPSLEEQRNRGALLERAFERSVKIRERLENVLGLVRVCGDDLIERALDGELTVNWRNAKCAAHQDEVDINYFRERRVSYLDTRRGVRLDDGASLCAPNGKVPKAWIPVRLSDVTDIRVGPDYKSAERTSSGERLLRTVNITPRRLDWRDEQFVSTALANQRSAFRLKSGDIVLALDRPVVAGGLKVAMLQPRDEGALLGTRVATFRMGSRLSSRYAWWFFNSARFKAHLSNRATGSSIPHITKNDVLAAPLTLPPIAEQQEIAARLDNSMAVLKRVHELASDGISRLRAVDEKLVQVAVGVG